MDDDGAWGFCCVGLFESVEEAAGGAFSHFFAGVFDGGHFGLDDACDGVVVEADDGDVFGDADAGVFEGLHADGAAEVVGDEEAVGHGFSLEELFGGADAIGFAEVSDDEVGGIEFDAFFREGEFVAFEAVGVYVSVKVGCDMCDVFAALFEEVVGGFFAGADVVDDDAGSGVVFFDAIEEDDGDIFLDEGFVVVEIDGIECEGGDEAVDAFVKKVVGVGGFFAVGFGGVADDEVVASFGGNFFDAGEDG